MLEQVEKKNSLFKNFKWDFVSVMVKYSVKIFLSVFLSRILSPTDFGLFAIAMVFIDISMLFVNGGYGSAIIKNQSTDHVILSSIFIVNLLIGLCFSLVLVSISGLVGSYYNDLRLSSLLKYIALLPILKAILVVPRALLYMRERYRLITYIDIIALPFSGVLGVILALNGYEIYSLVYMVLFQELLTVFMIWFSVKWKPSIVLRTNLISEHTIYGFKVFQVNFINKFNQTADALIIGRILGTESLGYYNRAKSFEANINSLVGRSVSRVLFPRVSSHKTRYDSALIFEGIFAKQVWFLFLLIGLLFINIEDIFLGLFSAKWIKSVPYVKSFLLIGFTRPLISTIQSMFQGIGELSPLLALERFKFLLNVICLLALWRFGLSLFIKVLVLNAFLMLTLYFSV